MSQGQPPSIYQSAVQWIFTALLTALATIVAWGAGWEHNRISELERARLSETERLARIEEKIDMLNWRLEQHQQLSQPQLRP